MINENNLFFTNIDYSNCGSEKLTKVIDELKVKSTETNQQIFVIDKPLTKNEFLTYDINKVVLILIPQKPIFIVSYGNYSDEELEDYKEDLKEDLGGLSSKYGYIKILQRTRNWSDDMFKICDINNIDVSSILTSKLNNELIRKGELLISLLIGSINNIDKLGDNEPQTILDKIKQKIILFDGKQSSFIYLNSNKKSIKIQGMAGTGKTELLLYKLKEIFINEKDSNIAFTCHNKVLAKEMKKRIPAFFNTLKVEEQIKWDEKFHVFPSWGSKYNPNSGLYSYICDFYNIPFFTYSQKKDFDELCKQALDKLNSIDSNDFEPCFDYIFIDESQDFGENFFDLCKKITRKQVFIAGDIFQNIFYQNNDTDINTDFLLKNCYRTDPKTFMVAHSMGLGLYEKPPISWLDDDNWDSCGYQIERIKNTNRINLSRKPLRRFEDIDTKNTFILEEYNSESNMYERIIDTVQNIKKDNPTVNPDDIAIIIIQSKNDNYNSLCRIGNIIEKRINDNFNWFCTKGYETKEKFNNTLFISNINNIKGLEFPFVICITTGVISKDDINYRNSLYMSLTRSFLTSYLFVERNQKNSLFIDAYESAILDVNRDGVLSLTEPTEEEINDMKRNIDIKINKSSTRDNILNDFLQKYKDYLDESRKSIIEKWVEISKDEKESDEEFETALENIIQVIIRN